MVAFLRRLNNRVKMMVARGVIKLVDDSEGVQLVQISLLKKENRSDIEHFQNFGFSSHPDDGTEGVCVFLDGDRSRGFLIATDNRKIRIKDLKKGESVQYNSKGTKIHLQDSETCLMELKKLKVDNGVDEMVSVVSEFMRILIEDAKVLTAIGPQQFTADTITALQAEKEKFDGFKE